MSEQLVPGSARYHERDDPGVGWRQRLERGLLAWPARYRHLRIRRELSRLEGGAVPDPSKTPSAGNLRRGPTTQSLIPWSIRAREAGADKDLLAGALALIRGMAVQCGIPARQAEMASFASQAIAQGGHPVHVLAPDDARALEMAPVLRAHLQPLGLRTAVIIADTPVAQRREAYRAEVTVLSAREALRDYLNDRLQTRRRMGEISRKLRRLSDQDPLQYARMRGLPFGIVIDANRLLIDQACEPLTIAGYTDPVKERAWAETALALARDLKEGLHFTADNGRSVQLTAAGRLQLEHNASGLRGIWCNAQRRNTDACLALQALKLEPGRHYRLVGQRVELPAGAPAPEGLIQLLEAREGLPVSGRAVPRAKLTLQRFFRRYESLAAVCDDIRYIRGELWRIYGLPGFVDTAVTSAPVADTDFFSTADKRVVETVYGFSVPLGRQAERALGSWRAGRRRKAAERQRGELLRLDSQAGNVTAFSGRTE